MKKQQRGSVFGAGFAIKDGEAVNLYSSIRRALLHRGDSPLGEDADRNDGGGD
jgi:hypothetical protein